ncbi:hypothetical protein EDD18DRAFT_1401878 [Armillaria luteobubalina]|uniref:Uncharacterized protein n=1 Tax=Armillaria luteobubalina TaxID=153913 RepID=A0AA39URI1_9AGAR|nr:hypothetical protein EDD18DRAFT_1401878 [Armillaria luteobubalina]
MSGLRIQIMFDRLSAENPFAQETFDYNIIINFSPAHVPSLVIFTACISTTQELPGHVPDAQDEVCAQEEQQGKTPPPHNYEDGYLSPAWDPHSDMPQAHFMSSLSVAIEQHWSLDPRLEDGVLTSPILGNYMMKHLKTKMAMMMAVKNLPQAIFSLQTSPDHTTSSDVPQEYHSEVDRIFFEYLNRICSNLNTTDSKGEALIIYIAHVHMLEMLLVHHMVPRALWIATI